MPHITLFEDIKKSGFKTALKVLCFTHFLLFSVFLCGSVEPKTYLVGTNARSAQAVHSPPCSFRALCLLFAKMLQLFARAFELFCAPSRESKLTFASPAYAGAHALSSFAYIREFSPCIRTSKTQVCKQCICSEFFYFFGNRLTREVNSRLRFLGVNFL